MCATDVCKEETGENELCNKNEGDGDNYDDDALCNKGTKFASLMPCERVVSSS